MLNMLMRLYDSFRDPRPVLRKTPVSPTAVARPGAVAPAPEPVDTLQPVKNWSHPFKNKSHPLLQLTQLAEAAGGYYSWGVNGMWHGGVHFESGTAGVLDQSSVCGLADGEVVAYRIDKHSPTTPFETHASCVPRPFSRNFVLVRHRLQPPKIEGSADTPPTLIVYSLYMHLQDWAVYQADSTIARPAFWPEGATRHVKESASDVRVGPPERRGLNVRNQAHQGKTIAFLSRGAEVTVSGKGDYRKLENTPGPDHLRGDDGALRGYVFIAVLELIAGDQFRVKSRGVNVRAEASAHSNVIAELPPGTEVRVSGEGEFRKLEHINQYVHFNFLQGAQEPLAHDRIVVLDQPIAIKAGDLIGHIGFYQGCSDQHPEKRFHLEVISGEGVDDFIKASRDWAKRLPASEKTWLKIAKGTAVVPHQAHYSATRYPIFETTNPLSGADLLLPKSLLDGLSAERKIVVPDKGLGKAYTWYRLDGLLNDAEGSLIDGWVREEVGVTPWFSPWSWEGYDIIFSYDSPLDALASLYRNLNKLNEAQLERYSALAEKGDKGRVKTRLYDLIPRDPDGKITPKELQAAIKIPAHAQAISQLIIHCESEWHRPKRWDILDEFLGHSGSTPHLNWLAEKERIKELSWWDEVAGKVGLPTYGKVYHFHPVGLVASFANCIEDVLTCHRCRASINLTEGFFREICSSDVQLSFLNSTHKCNAHPCMHFVRRLPAQALARA
ncbi:SH3 domain-containing protein [Pseudomonas brenneri]